MIASTNSKGINIRFTLKNQRLIWNVQETREIQEFLKFARNLSKKLKNSVKFTLISGITSLIFGISANNKICMKNIKMPF